MEHPDGRRYRLACRYPLIDLPSRGPEQQRQCQESPQVQRHSFGGITNVVGDIDPERARCFTDMPRQRRPHTPPQFGAPDRLALPHKHPGNCLLLNLLNFCQHISAPGSLLGNTGLQVEQGRASCLYGRLLRCNGCQSVVNLLKDRLGSARSLSRGAGSGPCLFQFGKAVQPILKSRLHTVCYGKFLHAYCLYPDCFNCLIASSPPSPFALKALAYCHPGQVRSSGRWAKSRRR